MTPGGLLKADWASPLAEADTEYWKLICEASTHQYLPVDQNRVLANLKFLTSIADSGALGSDSCDPHAGQSGDCACADYAPFTEADYEAKEEPKLRLTSPGALAGCKHYVAISYCWRQLEVMDEPSIYSEAPSRYTIYTANGVRNSQAPATLIHRAIRYAANYSFRLIWIDQECIDQDNLSEKEESIQAMHLIYRQSQQTIAVLTNMIKTQRHLDAFDSIGIVNGHNACIHPWWDDETKSNKPKPLSFFEAGIELTEILASDQWYTRAWTLQECLVAGGPLYMLIPCSPNLAKSQWIGSIPEEIVLSEAFFDVCLPHSFFNLLEWEEEGEREKGKRALRSRGLQTKRTLLTMTADYKMHGYVGKLPELARLSALNACGLLVCRGISEPSDLVAILGNLCQYNIRLDTRSIRSAGLSFSICALALSLLNGDMSLFLGLDLATTWPDTCSWSFGRALSVSSIKDAIDQAARIKGALETSSSIICRIFQPVLTAAGPLIQGTLWAFEQTLDCQEERLLFAERYQKGRNWDLGEEIFFYLLAGLQKSVSAPLAKALFASTRFRVLPPYISDELRLLLEPAIPTTPKDPADHWDTSRIWWLVDCVMNTGAFHVAVPMETSTVCRAHDETFVLLAKSPEEDYLFTPRRELVMDEGLEIFAAPFFLLSWWVKPFSSPELETLECIGPPAKLQTKHGKEVLICGYLPHFYDCECKSYLLSQPFPSNTEYEK